MSASEAACASACLSNYIVAMLHVKFFFIFFFVCPGKPWHHQGFEFGFGILTTAVSCQIYFNFLFAVECAKFSIPRQAGAATGEAEEASLLLTIGRRLAVCQKLSKQHEQHDRPEPPNQASLSGAGAIWETCVNEWRVKSISLGLLAMKFLYK